MSISRFFGATSREAMRQVRLALGPDALIVSNKRVNGGVEILATDSTAIAAASAAAPPSPRTTPPSSAPMTPPPREHTAGAGIAPQELVSAISSLKGSLEGRIEELMWSNQLRSHSNQLTLFQSLLTFGFSTTLLRAMLQRLPAQLSLRAAMQWVRKELDTHLPVLASEDHLWQPGLALALVGPTGVGKTTTLAKLAARAVKRFGADQVVLLTTDTYRIGADTQLKIYADLMRIPLHVVRSAQELRQVMLGLRSDQLILIDNIGVSQRDHYIKDQAALLASAGRRIQRLLVLNAASHGDTLDEVARVYRQDGGTALAGCVITKVDEASRLGAALDIALRYQLPIHYVSDGQKVPEHLRYMTATQLVDRALAQSPSGKALFAPSTADLAALVTATEVQAQAQHSQATTHNDMLKHALALSHLAHEDLDRLQQVIGLVDYCALGATAFDMWRDIQSRSLKPIEQLASEQLRTGLLEATENQTEQQPVVFHHVYQRLTGAQAQLYASMVGDAHGALLAVPLLQLSAKKTWYSNTGINQQQTEHAGRVELMHALDWISTQSPPMRQVHWVGQYNNQLWAQWEQQQAARMALVPPATRCWHINGHTTPAAIAKGLEFYALNAPKMALKYTQLGAQPLSELSFWYASAPIELRSRGGQSTGLELFVVQLLDAKTLAEVKTYYCFALLDSKWELTAEQKAVWLLQHLEAKNALRFIGRAYHFSGLRRFAKQYQLSKEQGLEFAAALGGAAWELEQYAQLEPLRQLSLKLGGAAALRQTQINASLFKLFNLKNLLQQPS